MLIRDRIFDKLDELNMTQKVFSERTGIPQSTVSDWRKKRTNPTAEKIMIVCEVLGVTPEWLLSGIEAQGNRGNSPQKYVVDVQTDPGILLECYNSLDQNYQAHLLGYALGLKKMTEDKKEKKEKKAR